MRIISGKYKNRELQSPNSTVTHPMGERERLAIFNMLGDLSNKTVLDLFAGTGALGIEALSRGAASAVFVEDNNKTLQVLKSNLENIENAKIIRQDVYKFSTMELYDIIFIDPPYDAFDEKILDLKKYLNHGGTLVISSPKPLNESSRKYANCYITLYYWPQTNLVL